MKKMFFILSAFMFISVGLYYYNIYLNQMEIKDEVSKLYKTTDNNFKDIDLTSFQNLPTPVENYFKTVLTEKSKSIQFTTYKYKGSFIPSLEDDPMMIDGIGYYNIKNPSFIWQGRIKMMNIVEQYKKNIGSTKIELLDIFSVVDRIDKENNKAQYLRWIVESVLYPTNLLPSQYIKWEAIDDNHAKLITNFNNINHEIIVTFKNGYIEQLSTNRFYGENAFKQWSVNVDNYKQHSIYKVPTHITMSWKLDNQHHTYLDYYITKIDFNTLP
jgi:hypothetical protein